MAAAAGKAVKAAKTSAFLGVAGCILAGGIGFAEARHEVAKRQAMPKWANDSGTWVNVTGQQQSGGGVIRDYRCTSSETTCTAEFPEGVNPNDQDHDSYPGTASPSNVVLGVYAEE